MKNAVRLLSVVSLVMVVSIFAATASLGASSNNTADVIVLGGGGSGLAAAAQASSEGVSVILLEKMPFLGGATVLSGGAMSFAGTDMQIAAGIEDSNEKLSKELMKVGGNKNVPSLVQAYVDNQLDTYYWLKNAGVEFFGVGIGGGMDTPRSHTVNKPSLVNCLKAMIEGNGGQILMETEAKRLIQDPQTGKVTGVIAEQDGKEVTFRANKGVVLATGGFVKNQEMLEKFVPRMGKAMGISGPGNVGDGLKMAWALGADVSHMPYIKATFGQSPESGTVEGLALIYYDGAIIVNQDGKRFVDESINYKAIGDVCLEQPNGMAYQVFDANIRDKAIGEVSGLEKKGYIREAATLKELAQKIGVPATNLENTVAAYNAAVQQGDDKEFGRENLAGEYGELVKIEKPPFYAFPSTAVILGTYCGVLIDNQARVIDVFGNVIPGLWAAGEVTGGFHGEGYMTGTAVGKAVIFGRIAGRNAAKPAE